MQYIRLFKIDHAFKDYSQYYFIKGALNTTMGKFYFVRHGQTVWNDGTLKIRSAAQQTVP